MDQFTSTETSTNTPMDSEQKLCYVALVCSAGGLDVLRNLVPQLPLDPPACYIVVSHRAPNFPDHLSDILANVCPLPVEVVQDGIKPQAGVVYIAPSGRDIVLNEKAFQLLTPSHPAGLQPSIDRFLMSLAHSKGDKAITLVLSGNGNDGAFGVKNLLHYGSCVLVQEPHSAIASGMPKAAIEAGGQVINLDLLSAELKQALNKIGQEQQNIKPFSNNELRDLLRLILHRTGMDFNHYKDATLSRQIRRRMSIRQLNQLSDYISHLEQHPDEMHELANSFLISVTSFFRDNEAYLALRNRLKLLVSEKKTNDEIRIWVPGCATGEEVYSIAIILSEELEDRLDQFRVQIFGSDISLEAVQQARSGIYPEATLLNMPTNLAKKYFNVREGAAHISKKLKEFVLFARQDLIQDPPFVRLDLISCRNLLIYLKPELQDRILKIFHYSLRDSGILLLGKSETVGRQANLFAEQDRKNKLYIKRNVNTPFITNFSKNRQLHPRDPLPSPKDLPVSSPQYGQLRLNNLYLPASLLITRDGEIVELYGDCSPFLSVKPGKADFNLYTLVKPIFRAEIRAYAHRVIRSQESAYGLPVNIEIAGQNKPFRVAVHFVPQQNQLDNDLLLISFEPARVLEPTISKSTEPYAEHHVMALEQEVQLMRENLQTVIEELEAANEELQSLNEESQAANEELQATNEEMETSNEELQASNEELIMVNDELGARTNELLVANDDMNNILNSIHQALIVVDRNLSITRFNREALQFFHLSQSERNNLASAHALCEIPELLNRTRSVLTQGSTEQLEFNCPAGRYYMMRITPYLQNFSHVDGAVIVILDVTERKQHEVQLASSNQRLQMATQAARIGIWCWNVLENTLHWDQQMCEIYGVPSDLQHSKLLYDFWSSRVHPDDLPMAEKKLQQQLAGTGVYDPTFRIQLPNGRIRHVQAAAYIERNDHGQPKLMVGINQDITERTENEERLRLAASVFTHTHEGIIITDEQTRIVDVNHSFEVITGYSRQEVLGKNPRLLQSGQQNSEFYREMWQTIHDQKFWCGEMWNRRKNGEVFAQLISISKVCNREGELQHYVAVFSDITQIKAHQTRLEYLAHYDALTSLPNRLLFSEHLQQAMAQTLRRGNLLAVLYLDLDGFKNINDQHGHEIGDQMLISVAQRMQAVLREGDMLARIGGDEFVASLVDLENSTDYEQVLNRLLQAAATTVEIEGHELNVSASIGVTLYPQDGIDADQLLRQADQAMYQAKQSGKNHFHLFDIQLNQLLKNQQVMREQIRFGLSTNQFELYYQPKINMRNGQIVGVEALLRWNHPEQGLLLPASFLPLVQDDRLSITLGEWVINTALTQIRNWFSSGLKLQVSINISARQLQQTEFVDRLGKVLSQYPTEISHYLELEILESSALQDIRLSKDVMDACRTFGVQFALDDFGTGYSSLTYLKHLPVNTIKIDQSFVQNMLQNPDDERIVKAVVQLSVAFQRKVIAEGVETAEQSEALLALGCEIAQGYIIAPPMPGVMLQNWITAWLNNQAV